MPANTRAPVTKLLPFALALHLFLPVAIVGQNAAGPPPAAHDQAETCTVQGTVVSAATGQPLKSVRVRLIDRDHSDRTEHPEGFTDAAGQFLITDVPAGTYHFRASKVGFVEQAYHRDAGGPAQLLVVAPGDKVDKVLFRLERAAVIFGRITDESGEPAISTEVLALVSDAGTKPNLNREWDPGPVGMEGSQAFEVALTNDLGEYRLYSLPPGKYFVATSDLQVHIAGFGANGQPRGLNMATGLMTFHSEGHPLLYYPGVFNPSEAEAVVVKAGQEARVDLSLRPVKVVTVSGRVLGLSGKPANDINVHLRSHTDPNGIFRGNTRASTDAQGNFEIKKVMPGRYTVLASFNSYDANGASTYWAEQPLEVAAEDISGLLLQLSRGVELSGKITTTEATKLNLEGLNVSLEGMEIPFGDGSSELNRAGSDHVTKDGTFTLPNAVRTTYRMSLSGLPDNWYARSATFGGQNVLEDGLRLADVDAGHSLDITLSPGVAQVDGMVLRGDNPVPGALVRLLPDPNNPFRNLGDKTAWADPKGHFHIPNIVPGSYRAVAYDVEADPGADEDEPPSVSITLTEKESKTVQLKFAQTP
jgi:protocatechuate 3,4-dioxygenase beta subunit